MQNLYKKTLFQVILVSIFLQAFHPSLSYSILTASQTFRADIQFCAL